MLTIFLQQIRRDPFLALSLGELRPRLNADHPIDAPSEARQAGSQQEFTNLQDRHRPNFSLSGQISSLLLSAISVPVTTTPPFKLEDTHKNSQSNV